MGRGTEGRSRRGNALTTILAFGALAGFAALSVDLGLVRLGRTQLAAAVDAAVLSGTAELDGTAAGIVRAVARARAVAAMNEVLGSPVRLSPAQVEVGAWRDGRFVTWSGGDAKGVVAVRVRHTERPIASVLGSLAFGTTGYTMSARSTSARVKRGALRETGCFLPLAVPDCWVEETPAGKNPAPLKFRFTPSPVDAIAWGMPGKNPSSDAVRDQLVAPCGGQALGLGDRLYVNEGNHTSALKTVAELLNDTGATAPGTWNPALYGPLPQRLGTADTANLPAPASAVLTPHWGNTIEGPIALVDAGATCATAKFTGSLEITAFAWGVLYDVASSGSDKNVYVQLDLVNPHEAWGEIADDARGNLVGPGRPQLVVD